MSYIAIKRRFWCWQHKAMQDCGVRFRTESSWWDALRPWCYRYINVDNISAGGTLLIPKGWRVDHYHSSPVTEGYRCTS